MRIVGLILISWLISGCSTVFVQTEYSENADFSKFKTFQYLESSVNFADTYPNAHLLVLNDVRGEMISAGLTEVDTNPDLDVTYYGEENEKKVLKPIRQEYHAPQFMRMSPGGRFEAGSFHAPNPIEVVVREGILLIDIWEVGNKELVWRAEISDSISSDPARNMAKIKDGIDRAFNNFPPASGL